MDLLALVAPSRCLCCRRPDVSLCESCRRGLWLIRAPLCARCGRPTAHAVLRCRDCADRQPAYATARAAVVLHGTAALLVRAWKDDGLRQAGAVALQLVLEHVDPVPAAVVVAVPADLGRARRRGVDGPVGLAAGLARAWGLPAPETPLVRRGGRPQRGLARPDRRQNARAAYALRAGADLGGARRVLLVDDVLTTGATVEVCAGLLRGAGAARVDVVTLARVVR